MSRLVTSLYRDVMWYMDGMDTHEYVVVLLGVIVLGFFCLRGFGSRTSY